MTSRSGRRLLAGAAAATSLAGCSPDAPSVLDPRGPAAQRIADLWWLMLAISAVVFVGVCGMIVYAIVRGRRRTEPEAQRPVRWGEPFIWIAGIVVSGIVLVGMFAFALRQMQVLAEEGRDAELEIEVVGHDWWWEAVYPNGAVTANEIHIPAGEPVRLRLTTADVIHSFWIPQLGPKMDMVPGKENVLWLQADEPGRYRGQCAEYCGLQHANMIVFVVADAPDDFERWVEREAEPADDVTDAELVVGRDLFLNGSCAGCHTIRGTSARGNAGPDLTHLASRETLASGTIPNTTGNLSQWILAPQSIKPGATMPPTELTGEQLRALIAYLNSLE